MDVELLPFRGMNVKAVFLHDVLTDLALGLDLGDIFRLYDEHIRDHMAATPGFATKNLPLLLGRLKGYGIANPLVLTHVNKVGFMMNPSRQECEAALKRREARVVAMGSLASGYLKPAEAYEYVYGLPSIVATVVGASSKAHIQETFGIIRSHLDRGS